MFCHFLFSSHPGLMAAVTTVAEPVMEAAELEAAAAAAADVSGADPTPAGTPVGA